MTKFSNFSDLGQHLVSDRADRVAMSDEIGHRYEAGFIEPSEMAFSKTSQAAGNRVLGSCSSSRYTSSQKTTMPRSFARFMTVAKTFGFMLMPVGFEGVLM